MKVWVFGTIVTALLNLSSCSPPETPAQLIGSEVPTTAPSTTQKLQQTVEAKVPMAAPVTFIDRVWVVAESKQVSLGELRVFLSEGTLVMASTHGTPTLGTWSYRDGHLTITEDGLKYKVDILELTANVFRIRINGPGEPVDIRFKLAEPPPLPENVSKNPERK